MDSPLPHVLAAHGFYRALDWRWRLAERVVAAGQRVAPRRHDPPTVAAVRYLRAVAPSRTERVRARAERRWADVAAARRLAAADGPRRWELEARLIAGQTDDEIARHVGLPPSMIATYEALNYHVRDRLGARDGLAARAVGPGLWTGFAPGDHAALWRAVAAFGGPLALEVVLAVTLGRPRPAGVVGTGDGRRFAAARVRRATRLAVDARSAGPIAGAATARRPAQRLRGRTPDASLAARPPRRDAAAQTVHGPSSDARPTTRPEPRPRPGPAEAATAFSPIAAG